MNGSARYTYPYRCEGHSEPNTGGKCEMWRRNLHVQATRDVRSSPQAVHLEHNRMPRRFGQVRRGFWEKLNNQQQFFDWMATQLGYKEMDDWYNITHEDIQKHTGETILGTYYGGSPSEALSAVYPEHNWR